MLLCASLGYSPGGTKRPTSCALLLPTPPGGDASEKYADAFKQTLADVKELEAAA